MAFLDADHFSGDDDDFNPRGLKKEERVALLADHSTIESLLEKIQTPWSSSVVADGPSGILMKERRRFGGWTQVHCSMRQNRMEWSSKQGAVDLRPDNHIKIIFATLEDFTQVEREMMSNQGNTKLSKQRLTIFSFEHMAFFTSVDDAVLNDFWAAIEKLLKSAMSAQDYEKRKEAAHRLIPLIDKRMLEELKRAEDMMACLMDQGLMAATKPSLKQGYLHLAVDGDFNDWKKLYFTLDQEQLNYRHSKKEMETLSKGERARASIGLRFARVEQGPVDPKYPNMFRIITPYVTYYLRAKHEVALKEWLGALSKILRKYHPSPSSSSSKKDGIEMKELGGSSSSARAPDGGAAPAPAAAGANAPQSPKLIDETPQPSHQRYTKPRLEFVDSKGKAKVVKIDKSKILLGRSTSNDVKLGDKSISRAHARIDYAKDLCVISDLGSSGGTQVNGQAIARKVLQPNDTLMLGKMSLQFLATPK